MENALLIGLSRQIALDRELEVVANNIANMNTTGYKADGSMFEEFLMPGARGSQFQTNDQRIELRAGPCDLARFHARSDPADRQSRSTSPSTAMPSWWCRPIAATRYTRNGALQISPTGELVTSAGDRVLGDGGPIQLQPTDHDISINANGTITVREGANTLSDSARGKLRLVAFDQPSQLQKDGSSLFAAPNGVAPQPAVKAQACARRD